ncbi:MAG TPA: glycine cleavage system protein GcvH [Coriobacteriia bacterium]|nr:glycine cleavage system protein GcvH [Coriobacteriia bacterium]
MYPDDLRYDKAHEWVRLEGDVVAIGISHFAQNQLGEVVYVDLPSEGESLSAGDVFGEIESVKSVSELYSPVDGEIVEVNDTLADAPETVNEDPYGKGWMIKVRLSDPAQLDDLLSAVEYEALLSEEA